MDLVMSIVVLIVAIGALMWPERDTSKIETNPRRPVPEAYRLKFTETYACVKKTLLQLFDPPAGWRIKEEDRTRGELRAYMELLFEVEQDGRTKEERCGITLDVAISTQPDGATDLVLDFRGQGPGGQQESLEEAMRKTAQAVKASLSELEVARHG